MARPASDISERIVHAARERFLLEGVEGASLRAIARDAGTNLGMVYYYYKTKDELFLAVVEGPYARLVEEMTGALSEPSLGTHGKIDRLYARLSAVNDDEMKVLRLVLREAIAGGMSSRMGLLFERFSRGHVMVMGQMLQNGMTRGEVRPDLPVFPLVIATLFLGLFPQVVRRRLAEANVPVDGIIPQPAELAKVLSSVLLDGLAPRADAKEKSARAPKSAKERQKKSH
jgi:AcrR family transcriptional regulator